MRSHVNAPDTHPIVRRALAAALLLTLSACGGGDAPNITAFSASPMTVVAGGTVTLSWAVDAVDNVKITAMPGGQVVSTNKASGTAESAALDADTTFVLVATKGDKSATRSVVVTITAKNAPTIDSFTATPMTVAMGGSTTLAWQTTNAVSVDIDVGARSVLSGGDADGSVSDTPLVATTTYLLTARAEDGTTATAMVTVMIAGEAPPMVTSFTAMPNVIDAGDTSTLRWTITGDNLMVTILVGGNIVLQTTDATGSLGVTPVQTTTYTLNVTNPAGSDSANAMVSVNPTEGASIVSFGANPTTVTYGVSSELSWEVANADRIEIAGNGAVVSSSTSLTGSYTVTPTITTDYQLTAFNPNGDATANVTVTFNPSAPVIVSFAANPPVAALGGDVELTWETIGALTVRILRDGVATATITANPNLGSIMMPVTNEVTRFTLEAVNPSGANMQSVTVYTQAAPDIVTFTATPLLLSGTGTTTVTVTWDVRSVSDLQLYADNVPVAAFPAVMTTTTATNSAGMLDLILSATTQLRLTAISAAGQAERTITIYAPIGEVEPNDDPTTATPVTGTDVAITGEINPAGDTDFYAITVPEGGSVFAETNDGMGGCPFDTTLALLAPDGTTQVAFNDDAGGTLCSRINPQLLPAATNLGAGTYYLRVRAYSGSQVGAYVLQVRILPAVCGNGILETRAAEQCDDGNVTAGDGCDSVCAAELLGMVTGPTAPGMVFPFNGSIQPVGRRDFIQVTMQASGYIAVDTFAPTAPTCIGADTRVALLDSAFNVLGEDNDDGVDLCARIDPQFDAFALVPAGTYYVRVEENGNNATIPAYVIQIRTFGVGCGNGIIDAGEICDDGNTVDGDGCSALCVFEGIAEDEAGGNDAFDGGGVVVINPGATSGSFTLRGDIDPAGDSDYFAIEVAQGYHVDAYLTVGSLTSCPVSPEGRVRFYDTDGTTLLASDDFSGPDGNCGRVYPRNDVDTFNKNAGTYYLRVSEDSTPALQMLNYYLHVTIVAPGCGNTYIEPGESCDDGNLLAGDGCSDTCTFEPAQVVTIPAANTTTVSGSIVPSYARMAVQIDVTATSYLYAETFAPDVAGGCPTADSYLRLYQADGVTQIGSDDFDGINNCSRITPADGFARLATGTYWLVVEEDGQNAEIPAIQVVVGGIVADVCGNGVVESAVGEVCDDGNVLAGDGCNGSCQLEPVAFFAGPPLAPTVAGDAISPIGNQDYYQLDLSAPAIIIAETFIPAVGGCAGGDTVLRLYDSALTQVTSNDDINYPTNPCSLISGVTNTAARVPAGVYFLRVEDFSNNDVIPAYEIQVELRARDVCGNGVPETGEGCDDGNTVDGDGCSALCQVEGPPPVVEIEPNSLPAEAQDLGTLGTGETVVDAAITPSGDLDFFMFTLATPMNAQLATFGTLLQPLTSCPGDTQMWLYNGVPTDLVAQTTATEPTLVEYDDDDNFGFCSRITGNETAPARLLLPAGTYYVQVRRFGNTGTLAQYFLSIDLAP